MVAIEVLYLGPVAKYRLKGEKPILDLDENQSLRLSKGTISLNNLGRFTREYSLPITIKATPKNEAILSEYNTPTVYKKREEYQIVCRVGSVGLPFTSMRISSYDESEYDIQLLYSNDHWLSRAAELKISEIDFGGFDIDITESAIFSNWDDYQNEDVHILMGIGDFGWWVDGRSPQQNTLRPAKAVLLEDLRPFFRLTELLKRGFCQIGWTLKGEILSVAEVRALTVYDLRKDYAEASRKRAIIGGKNLQQVSYTTYNQNNPNQWLRIDNIDKGPVKRFIPAISGQYACGVVSYSKGVIRYRIKLSFSIRTTNASAVTLNVMRFVFFSASSQFAPTGQGLVTPTTYPLAANTWERIYYERTFFVTPNPSQTIPLEGAAVTFTVNQPSDVKDLFFTCEPVDQCYQPEDTVSPVEDSFSTTSTLLDHLKGFAQMFDIRFEEDANNREVTMWTNKKIRFPHLGEVTRSFYLDGESAISDKFVEGSTKVTLPASEAPREYIFSWKPSTDEFVKSRNLPDQPFSRRLRLNARASKPLEEVLNPTYEPTLERQSKVLASAMNGAGPRPFFPVFSDNTLDERSFAIGPRVLIFWGKNVEQYLAASQTLETATFYFNQEPYLPSSTLRSNFPYLSMMPTWSMLGNIFDPSKTTLAWGYSPFDLYTISYIGFLSKVKNGAILNALFNINASEYTSENFRRPVPLTFKGKPVLALPKKIKDFEAGGVTATPVELEVGPADESCCDGPCGCIVRSCEYASPITFNTPAIDVQNSFVSSFIINGVEQLQANEPFQSAAPIELLGNPYSPAMADNLNRICQGASGPMSFFRFEYSSGLGPFGNAIFFKVIRPVCWTFQIIIEIPVYGTFFIAHASQSTVDGYNTPINCINYAEY